MHIMKKNENETAVRTKKKRIKEYYCLIQSICYIKFNGQVVDDTNGKNDIKSEGDEKKGMQRTNLAPNQW